MWETIKTLYHATIEAMSNRKGKKLVTHNQECKKKKIVSHINLRKMILKFHYAIAK